jgi:hypothetical protein
MGFINSSDNQQVKGNITMSRFLGLTSSSKFDNDTRKGLLEVMAELEEQEGNYTLAAKYYLDAAKYQANNSKETKGLSEYVAALIEKGRKCRDIAFVSTLNDPSVTWYDDYA